MVIIIATLNGSFERQAARQSVLITTEYLSANMMITMVVMIFNAIMFWMLCSDLLA